jgi:hypothetical protein
MLTTPNVRELHGDKPSHEDRGGPAPSIVRRDDVTDQVLGWGTTTLLVVIGIVHLHLWFDGYRNLPTIGPLFLVAVISAAVLALLASVQINRLIAFAAASFAAATLTANVMSLLLPNGLFRFKEIGVSYSGAFAIASEVGVVLLVCIWANRHRRRAATPLTS